MDPGFIQPEDVVDTMLFLGCDDAGFITGEIIKIDNGYSFTTLDSFIIDNGWLAIKAMKEGNGINVNTDAIKMI